ncbi:MAG: hypothetical protein IT160_20110 [Bryobacterales bacterium]|nr:hypothetical protein [Bryobacterales bacterium]
MAEEQSIEQQREALRAQNQVRLLTEAEEGLKIDRIPPGVYGYTHSAGSDAMPLFRKHNYLTFEVHKRTNGQVDLLGFLSASEAQAVEGGREDIEVRLYSDQGENMVLVSIPTERILHVKELTNRDGKGLVIQVAGFQ